MVLLVVGERYRDGCAGGEDTMMMVVIMMMVTMKTGVIVITIGAVVIVLSKATMKFDTSMKIGIHVGKVKYKTKLRLESC